MTVPAATRLRRVLENVGLLGEKGRNLKNTDAVLKCLNSSSCPLFLKSTNRVSLRIPKEPMTNVQGKSRVGNPQEKNKTSFSISIRQDSEKKKDGPGNSRTISSIFKAYGNRRGFAGRWDEDIASVLKTYETLSNVGAS